jgi:hypothetical protein
MSAHYGGLGDVCRGCGHARNWHVPGPACAACAGVLGDVCAGFVSDATGSPEIEAALRELDLAFTRAEQGSREGARVVARATLVRFRLRVLRLVV